ncbi:DUF4376 domain-containing protein [Bradyrhizobium barranii subsp. apii]|uniref:DUF4376 domain-containing protein n=1 Tax=Bradyrhizobium barranii subsp. apii TaxID=2819348 RepID=A0A8T5VBY7_9BRAD|nr:DUF4376 domain-containing protein [Bradyrhizobium barranii]UPT85178.1 DUF4376 domain-containing protein [Bradyrhizobium barranii subsp. apii]
MQFEPRNWYWAVGGAVDKVYSSQRNTYVPIADADFVAWLAERAAATKIASEAEIWPYVSDLLPAWLFDGTTFAQPTATTYSRPQLKVYAAAVRYDKEVGGISVGGMSVSTDRVSQSMINGAYNMAAHDASFTTKWKAENGNFTPLDAPTIIALAVAIGQHVAACFSTEADVVAQIDAGTLISIPEINAAFAAI